MEDLLNSMKPTSYIVSGFPGRKSFAPKYSSVLNVVYKDIKIMNIGPSTRPV